MDTPVTALGVAFQLIASGLLTYLIPRHILRKHGLHVPFVFTFFTIFSLIFAAGIIPGFIITLVLYGFFWWVALIGQTESRIMFIITFVLVSLYLPCSIVSLPIRLAAEQSKLQIATNVAAIFLGLAMLSSLVEWLILERQRKRRREEVEVVLANLQAD